MTGIADFDLHAHSSRSRVLLHIFLFLCLVLWLCIALELNMVALDGFGSFEHREQSGTRNKTSFLDIEYS
jgi:hypothetical protein